ncbi:MAG TPA: cupin [Vicinamibacteria bacterium]
MGNDPPPGALRAEIRSAEVVLPCSDLDGTLAFFTERLGFAVATIFPADEPRVAVLTGHGVRLRLERGREGPPGVLRLECRNPAALAGGVLALLAPNGTRVELVAGDGPLVLPPLRPSFVLARLSEASPWHTGRAGMAYRDLIPDRQGGRFIASHIRIPEGGPVPDYVHFHEIHFQLIYCFKGWVRVVYEDQGPPFVMQAGDCVLQPPRIRHRVLESSPGLEVVEISSPAEHATHADSALALPTAVQRPDRDFGGQRFVRHEAARATFSPWRMPGFEARDLGIAAATDGLATARVARVAPAHAATSKVLDELAHVSHDAELLFTFVLAGGALLLCEGQEGVALAAGDAFVIPAGRPFALTEPSPDLELLEVSLPARFTTRPHSAE